MKTKFTPGPWSVGPPHVVAHRAPDERGRRTTRFVAEAVLAAPVREGEREANAHLIAASPEMHGILSDISQIDWAVILADPYAGGLNVASLLSRVKRVLAKARGEQL